MKRVTPLRIFNSNKQATQTRVVPIRNTKIVPFYPIKNKKQTH